MNTGSTNYWFLVACWWILMVVLGAMFAMPIFDWEPTAKVCKLLMSPAILFFVAGLIFGSPKRYLFCLASIGILWVLPTIVVCLTPLGSLAYMLRPMFTAGDFSLLFSALMGLSIWFIVMRLIRERRMGVKPADSHIFFEEGIAYIELNDLQSKHSSIGDKKRKLLTPTVAGLAMTGYPLQKFLALIVGKAAVTFFIAILLTPVASWLLAWMVCKFASWALPVWRYERTSGRNVYLKRPY